MVDEIVKAEQKVERELEKDMDQNYSKSEEEKAVDNAFKTAFYTTARLMQNNNLLNQQELKGSSLSSSWGTNNTNTYTEDEEVSV